ncbi:MAG: mandelate racemase/muconate lactonizing enzyme family protein [Fuerstiella sp.]|nr:mandelate racemase/muconate lactonizing enzyme family protein [Fuerstiella sp.]
MKIESIERIWVDLPLREVPWRNMVREIPHWSLFELCKVTLSNGVVGVGETMPYYTWGEVTDEAVERVHSQHPAAVMWDDSLGAGLQMALFDAVGQSLDTPVWGLLGQKIRSFAHVGWWAIDMPVEDWICECTEAVEHGYTTFKTKARPWFDLEDQVARLSDAVPDYFKLDMDFNDFGLDPAVARPLCKRLERFEKVAIWESPIAQEDVEGNRALRKHLSVPIAHHVDRPAFETQIRRDICDGFVMEGGISNALSRGRTCAEFNKPFWLQWVGSNLAAAYCLHIQAALSHARWPAIHCNHMYSDQFINEPWVVSNGLSPIPDTPGIGVTVNWDIVEKYRIEAKDKPYPHPDLLLRLDWPSGTKSWFTHAQQLWDAFTSGDLPAFVSGVNLTRVKDDGSAEWRKRYEQACVSPIHDPS